MNIKICTLNVNGLGDLKKRRQIFKWVRDNKISICLLQETHSIKQIEPFWQSEWGFDAYFSGNSTNSCGIGILINNNFEQQSISVKELVIGRLMVMKIEIQGINVNIINIYGPNRDDVECFYKMQQFIEENSTENFLIGGDFNVVLEPILDKENGLPNRNIKCRRVIKGCNEKYDLIDIWRLKHENIKSYTWKSNHTPPIKCRLDYFLISSYLLNIISKCEISTCIKTDHSPVVLHLCINKQKKGPGYFKMNNSILLDTEYQNIIKTSIQTIAEINANSNPNTLWEIIKGTIRNETIKYSSRKKKQDQNKEYQLQAEIDTITKNIQENPNNTHLNELKTKKMAELEEIYDKKINGIILRSKARWVEGGEKNSKYFANLEKRNYESKIIHKLNINGKEIKDPINILEEQKNFYKSLYDKRTIEGSDYDFFPETFNQKLTEEDKESCEGLITDSECIIAIKSMNNNKSPGTDGITCEFYKLFWNDVGKYLISSLNYSYSIGKLTALQKQSIITLLPKKDKDLTKLENWRPISLLNTDYKIATKVIANRLKKSSI